jgi:hypothetical protein
MDVPLIVFVAVSHLEPADVMLTPGAKNRRSCRSWRRRPRVGVVVAPDRHGRGDAGRGAVEAFTFSLPAATAKVTPALIALATRCRARGRPATEAHVGHGLRDVVAATQSTPAMTPELVPDPVQPAARTAWTTRLVGDAVRRPAAVPATCVPWAVADRWRSRRASRRRSRSQSPANSAWELSTPVSMT